MSKQHHGAREPLFVISKRDSCGFLKACLIRLAAIVLALGVCAVVIFALTGLNPLEVYSGIISGAVGSNRRLWVTIRDALVLLCIAVAITPAFRMRFWNIGAEGQTLIGGLATAAIMINLGDKVSSPVLFLLMILASVIAGMIWGVIPAFFKAKWNTNETLFTLMMNYIATQLVAFCIVFWENPAGSNSVGIINSATKAGWLGELFGQKYGWNVVIVLTLAIFMYVYLRYSKQGYEIAYVGQSVKTARYAGINVTSYKYLATCIGGAICGLGGLYFVMEYSGGTWTNNGFGDRGWLAIALVIFARWNPLHAIWGSILFGALYILYLYIPGLGRSMQEIFKMLPYIVTIVVLVLTSLRKKKEDQPPESLGLAYFREER